MCEGAEAVLDFIIAFFYGGRVGILVDTRGLPRDTDEGRC